MRSLGYEAQQESSLIVQNIRLKNPKHPQHKFRHGVNTIGDYCTEKVCKFNIPPFSKGKLLSSKHVKKTRQIASSRIHIERAIDDEFFFFFFLQKVIPLKVKHTIDNVALICAAICNLYPKLVQ